MSGGPFLITERLELWQPVRDDLAAMHAIVSDAATGRYLAAQNGMADQFQRFARNAGSWWLYGYGSFTVRRRGSSEVIGNCGLFHSWRGLGEDFDDRPEAGWILRPDAVGQGLAHEALTASLGWFERAFGAHEIACMIALGNARSFALAERLGFRPLRDAVLPDGAEVRLLARPPQAAG